MILSEFLYVSDFTNYNFLQLSVFLLCLLPNSIFHLDSVLFCVDITVDTSNIHYWRIFLETAIIIYFFTSLWETDKNVLFNINVTLLSGIGLLQGLANSF